MVDEIQQSDTWERGARAKPREHPAGKAIKDVLKKMAAESPGCVVLCVYEDETGYPMCHITDGTILNPETFSCFMARVQSAAEEALSARLAGPSPGQDRTSHIIYVMVETERFTMFSRRIANCLSLLLVLRSPAECLGMPIELLDRWEPRIRELVINPGAYPVS